MKRQGERSVSDLYDRTRHKALEPSEEQVEGCGEGRAEASEHELLRMKEDKSAVRKRPISSVSPHMRTESGTCNVCSAPCSSCLHRSLALVDSKIECGSSQTCCARTETDTSSFIGSDKRLHSKGRENDDELSATSSHASYSETAGNKATVRSSIVRDSSEVDMPAKHRRLLNQDMGVHTAECHDDSNSCVTGISAERKLPVDMKKDRLCSSASSRDLLAKGSAATSQNREYQTNQSKLRNTSIEESPRKKRSDFHDMQTSSSQKLVPAELPSCATKKLLRIQSSVSVSQGLSPQRQDCGLGDSQNNLVSEPCGKAPISKNNAEYSSGGKVTPCTVSGDKHDTFTNCGTSNTNKISAGSSSKDPQNDISCSRNEVQAPVEIQSKDGDKRNGNDKQDQKQNCSLNATSYKKSKIQYEVVTEGGNNEGLIDVNVCDICGDLGREDLLATCTRCLEGAEHTYCMRVKLDKVPDGDWLCEECQLKEAQNKRISNSQATCGMSTAKFLDGKNQNSESMANRKKLQVVVTDLEARPIACGTSTADHLDGKNENSENIANHKKLEAWPTTCGTPTAEHSGGKYQNSETMASCKELQVVATDSEARLVTCGTPTAERLDGKNKNSGNMANRKKLQVVAADLEARLTTCSTPTTERLDGKNQNSEIMANRKKLQVATDLEALPPSEGLWSPPKSFKRHAESTSSLTVRKVSETSPRHLETNSPRKHSVFSRENSFKKSHDGSLKLADNAPVRAGQAVKSSLTLSRSYSLGNASKVKAQIPSPRGVLSKQLSFNNLSTGPKVKQLTEGVPSKLKPAKQSPRDPREKGLIRKVIKSASFKNGGSICKDISSLKQKQSFHLSRSEEPRILKPMREKNLLERRISFNLEKPNIPLSPEPDSPVKTGDSKIDQHSVKSESSILKNNKKPRSTEKKLGSHLSKSDKQDTAKHQRPIGVVSGEDGYATRTSDSLIPRESGKTKESKIKHADEAVLPKTLIKNNDDIPDNSEELSTPKDDITHEIALQDTVPKSSHNLTPKGMSDQQEILENTESNFCKTVETVHVTEDVQPAKSHCLPIESNLDPPANELNEPDSKLLAQDFCDQSSILGNPFRALVIPEQNCIWRGSFEVSRSGMCPEMFDGIQAHLSTCVSPKVLAVVKQLPHRIELEEVPRLSSWPLQFQEVKPSEDNVALFFFAKDLESYERTYGKLLGSMLANDSSLRANISGVELLIFPSDKLPENTQRWNSLFFLWGVFHARKLNCSKEFPDAVTDHCVSILSTESVVQHMCTPKVLPSLGIDLNECPHDEFFGGTISLELEAEKFSTSGDHKPLLDSGHEDGKPDAREMCAQESASTRQIILESAVAGVSKAYIPTNSTGDCSNIMSDNPNAATGSAGAANGDKLEEETYIESKAPFCVQRHAAHTAMDSPSSNKRSVKKCAHLSFLEAPPQHSSVPSNVSDEASELIPMANFISLDGDTEYKRRKIFDGAHSSGSLGDEQLPSKCLSKIHPLPAGQHRLSDGQYSNVGAADPGPLTKLVSDHVIHVLSSDDEDLPESSTPCLGLASVNKMSFKAEGPPLLSLSFVGGGSKHNLANSATGDDDRSLSLSLGLPGVKKGMQKPALEMKQFLPEKPGINTTLLL